MKRKICPTLSGCQTRLMSSCVMLIIIKCVWWWLISSSLALVWRIFTLCLCYLTLSLTSHHVWSEIQNYLSTFFLLVPSVNNLLFWADKILGFMAWTALCSNSYKRRQEIYIKKSKDLLSQWLCNQIYPNSQLSICESVHWPLLS